MNAIDRTREIFTAIDRMDTTVFASFLTHDARFTFGNTPTVSGKPAIEQAVAGFFGSIRALIHRLQDIWETPGHVVCRGEVTYTRLDGRQVTIPFANVFAMQGDLVRDYRIYIDVAPLYAE